MSNESVHEPRGVLRNVARWLVRKYYPRIEITDADRIPQSGPVLLCANHANSLLDPIMIGIVAQRPVRFMAKAPLFDHPVLGPPMRALGMIPAYRGRDDGRDVRKNVESLDVGAKALVAGQAMGIFPEGVSTDEAQLKMVRSGAARIVLQAASEGAEGVQVVPIGIAYEGKDQFRSSAWVRVGQPIDVDACLAEHDSNDRRTRRALTQQLEANLKEVVVHLDEAEWEPWLDDLQTLARLPAQPNQDPLPLLQQRKRIADAMNYFLANDRDRAESIAGDIEAYRNNVHAAGLCVNSPVLRGGLKAMGKLLWDGLCLIFLLIPALLGTLHHLAPFVVVRALAKRLDQPGRKTVSTNRMLVGVPIYLLWYVVVGGWMIRSGYSAGFIVTWLIAAPFCGVIAVHYWRRAGQAAQLLWHQVLALLSPGKLKHFREQELAIQQRLAEAASEYAAGVSRPETVAQPTNSENAKPR